MSSGRRHRARSRLRWAIIACATAVIVPTLYLWRRLDRYKRLGIRYERVEATLDDGRRVWVYQRLPLLLPAQ